MVKGLVKRFLAVSLCLTTALSLTGYFGKGGVVKAEPTTTEDFTWKEEQALPSDFSYSLMFVGDTQVLSYQAGADGVKGSDFAPLYDWIVDNVEERKTKYVFGLGDITQYGYHSEFQVVVPQIAKMDGVVPYSLVRGNHDYVRSGFEWYFGENSGYSRQYAFAYQNDPKTTVHKFSAGQLDYLALSLDLDYTDDTLEWACKVVEAHPYHNVIVTTHAYVGEDGELYSDHQTDGFGIWEKLVKKYPNIVMVVCGHIDVSTVVTSDAIGDNGNVIKQILINFQGVDLDVHTGMVNTFFFSEDGKTVTVDTYSPVQKAYYKDENQFTFTLNTIERENAGKTITVEEARGKIGLTQNVKLNMATGNAENGVSGFVTSMKYVPVEHIQTVVVPEGYELCWAAYDAQKIYLGSSDAKTENWLGDGVDFSPSVVQEKYWKAAYFRFSIKPISGDACSYADLSDAGFTVNYR